MFISINAILSITSLLGNILIVIALHKDSSLHPPSKLSYRCLSCTDLLVGLVSRPMYIIYLASSIRKNQMLCWINEHLAKIFSGILCGESHFNRNKCGQTPRSITEIKVQTNCDVNTGLSSRDIFLDDELCNCFLYFVSWALFLRYLLYVDRSMFSRLVIFLP